MSTGSFLMPRLEHATVSDAMRPGIQYREPDAGLTEVVRMMATHHVHCILVMGMMHEQPAESLAWGLICDLDLLRAGIRNGGERTARVLAQPVITVEPTMPFARGRRTHARFRPEASGHSGSSRRSISLAYSPAARPDSPARTR